MAKALKAIGSVSKVAAVVLAFVPGMQPFAAAASAIAGVADMGAQLLTTPEPTGGSSSQTTINLNAPTPYVIGRTYSGGTLVHDVGHGVERKKIKNPNRTMVFVYSDCGPVESIEGLYSDGAFVTQNGAVNGYYSGSMYYDQRLGQKTGETALVGYTDDSLAASPGWSAQHVLTGKAAGMVTLRWDKDMKKFAGGTPEFGAIVQGVKAYDPRLDSTYPGGSGGCRLDDEGTWTYTENPALHALTYAYGRYENGRRVFGVGKSIYSLDVPAFVEWSNVCDANGWRVGGEIFEPGDKWNNLKNIMQAGGGRPVHSNGTLSVSFDSPKVPVETFTEDDLANGEVVIPSTKSFRDRLNGVIPIYKSEAHAWGYISGSAVSIADYVAADGEDKRKEIKYTLVQDVSQAAQLAAYEVVNSRELSGVTIPLKTKALPYGPGEAITLDMPNLGLSGLFIIERRGFDPLTAITTLTVKSETLAKHAFALGATTTPPPPPTLVFGEDLDLTAYATRGTAYLIENLISSSWVRDLVIRATGSGEIILSNHSRIYADETVEIIGDTLTGASLGTLYSIYYDDEDRNGGAVTYVLTTDQDAAQTAEEYEGRHFVGYITTPETDTSQDTFGQSSTPPTRTPSTVPNALSVAGYSGVSLEVDIGALQGAVSDLDIAREGLEGDLINAQDLISAGLDDAAAARLDITGETAALILSEQIARENGDQSLSSIINALTSRIGDAEAEIGTLETTKADQSALTAEASRIDSLSASLKPSAIVTNFDSDQTAWRSGGANAPEEADTGPFGSFASIIHTPTDGAQMVQDGGRKTVVSRKLYPYGDGSSVFRLRGEIKIDRLHSGGIIGNRLRADVYLMDESLNWASSNGGFTAIAAIYEPLDIIGWQPIELFFAASSSPIQGTDAFAGSASNFDETIARLLRPSFSLNFVGDGSMRARDFTFEEVSDISSVNSDIIEERSARVSSDNAITTSLSGLTSRISASEGDIGEIESAVSSLQSSKADQADLTAEASRLDNISSRINSAEEDILSVEGSITTLENTKADAQALSAEASRIDSLTSSIDYNPNILRNGGLTEGGLNWVLSPIGSILETEFGPVLSHDDPAPSGGLNISVSNHVQIEPGVDYTFSYDPFSETDGNSIYADIVFRSASGAYVIDGSQTITNLARNFGEGRISHTETAPDNATVVQVRIVTRTYNAGRLAVRRLKIEKGSVATIWSDDATLEASRLSLRSDITTLQSTKADSSGLSAEAARIDAITIQSDENAAGIIQEATARAEEDSTLAGLITALTSTVDGNTASISQTAAALSTAEGAISQVQTDVTTANSSASANFLAIQEHDNLFAAGIGLRVASGNSYAGLELYTLSSPNGSASTARLAADQILLEGTIENAHIKNLSVDTIKISNGAITNNELTLAEPVVNLGQGDIYSISTTITSTGQPIALDFSCYHQLIRQNGSSEWYGATFTPWRIKRGGQIIRTGLLYGYAINHNSPNIEDYYFSLFGREYDILPPGVYTYTFELENTYPGHNGLNIKELGLSLTEFKK